MHTYLTQLSLYIQNNDVRSLVDLFRLNPDMLLFPLDGPDNSAQNEEIIELVAIIITAAKQQSGVLQTLLEHNPSILQAVDSNECSVLQAVLENKPAGDIETFLQAHRPFSIDYIQPHDQPLCFILFDNQHFDLCLSLLKQYPRLATILNLANRNILHHLCMRISRLELSVEQPCDWKIPASIVRFLKEGGRLQTRDKQSACQKTQSKLLAQSYYALIEHVLTAHPALAMQMDCHGSPPIHYAVYRDMALFETLLPHSQSVLLYWDTEEGSLVDVALQYASLPGTMDCLQEKLPGLIQQVTYGYMRNYFPGDDLTKHAVLLRYIELNSSCHHLFHPLMQFVLENDLTLFIHLVTLYPRMLREVDERGNLLIHAISSVEAWQWVRHRMPDTIQLQNHSGQTLAHRCATRVVDFFQQIITDCPALLHIADHLGRLPIHTLANQPDHIAIILMHDKAAYNKKDAYGRTLIDNANSHTLIKVQLLSYDALTLEHIHDDLESWLATPEWHTVLQQRNDLFNQQNQQGDTIAHILCKSFCALWRFDDRVVLDILMSLGQSVFKIKNHEGYYPLQYLLSLNNDLSEELITLLKQHHSPLPHFTGAHGIGLFQLQSGGAPTDVFSSLTAGELQQLIEHRDDMGNTVLHNVTDPVFSTYVLKHHSDILQYVNQYGESILHYQMRTGADEVVMQIMERVPELVHQEDHLGRLPFHFSQSSPASRAMLDQDPELFFAIDNQGRNRCHYLGLLSGRADLNIIAGHKDFATLLQQPDQAGNLPLQFFIQHCNDLGDIQRLIDAYPQALTSPNLHGILPIMNIGDEHGKQEALLRFFSLRAPNTVNMTDIEGCNIAHYQTKLLLWYPKLAFQMDALGRYPVHTATQRHGIGELEFYRDFAPHCLTLRDQQGRNLLHFAVQDRCSMPYSYASIRHEMQLSVDRYEDQFHFNLCNKSNQKELIDFIIELYPEMLTQIDDHGCKPMDLANENSRNYLAWTCH